MTGLERDSAVGRDFLPHVLRRVRLPAVAKGMGPGAKGLPAWCGQPVKGPQDGGQAMREGARGGGRQGDTVDLRCPGRCPNSGWWQGGARREGADRWRGEPLRRFASLLGHGRGSPARAARGLARLQAGRPAAGETPGGRAGRCGARFWPLRCKGRSLRRSTPQAAPCARHHLPLRLSVETAGCLRHLPRDAIFGHACADSAPDRGLGARGARDVFSRAVPCARWNGAVRAGAQPPSRLTACGAPRRGMAPGGSAARAMTAVLRVGAGP